MIELWSMEMNDEWHSLGVGIGTSAAQCLCQQHGLWDWVHPQRVCQHQSVWCSWHAEGKGWHPKGPWPAWEVPLCKPHEVPQGQVQDPAAGSGQPQAQIEAGQRIDWEQTWGKRLGGWHGTAKWAYPFQPKLFYASMTICINEG